MNNIDVVNHPQHYQSSNGVECIQAIEAATEDLLGLEAVCIGNVIKYVWRWKNKNGIEDLKKAKWYLEELISSLSDTTFTPDKEQSPKLTNPTPLYMFVAPEWKSESITCTYNGSGVELCDTSKERKE